MEPHDQPKCYLVFQCSKQDFISTYSPALRNQQLNPFLSRAPAGLSYAFNHQQLQLLQQQQQQLQSQHSFQRRSGLPTIWDCALPFHGMFLHQPQPHYAVIPCGAAAKRIRLEEVTEQPSNGVSNFPVSARLSPIQEAKLKSTQPPSHSLGIEGKDNGQTNGFAHDEARKVTRGRRKRKDKKMDMSMDVDTELRL